jgi:alkyl hydroperoxide reductase subunit F
MLQKIATKIHLLHLEEALRADAVLIDNFRNDPKVTIHLRAQTTAIKGETVVQSLDFDDLATGHAETLHVQGVFVAIGAIPNTEPIKDLLPLTPLGSVAADRYGATSVPGFFAAGDVTDIRDAQIVVAAAHGCSAALTAGDYLARQKVA